MNIGFIGLGKMGTPMARRLLAGGHKLTAFVRSAGARTRANDFGFTPSESIADLAAKADVVITALTDDEALDQVTAELAAGMREKAMLIETSTVSPAASARAAERLAAGAIAYLRSPVSGSTVMAEAGQLTVLASGPRAAYEACLPLYGAFSKKQYHLGEGDEARYLKIVLNAMVGATSALLAEALTIGRKGGLDVAAMLEVINNSAVASPLIGYKTRMLTSGDYAPAFPVTGMMKDFDIALEIGRAAHLPLPLTAQIRQHYEAAFTAGSGEDDFFVLAREAARIAGLKT